jgi:hypothetical protein
MTIQPSFKFVSGRPASDDNGGDGPKTGDAVNDGEKYVHSTTDRPGSVSSFNSDEKQTYGVSRVEAVTSVWTRSALITLYALYITLEWR